MSALITLRRFQRISLKNVPFGIRKASQNSEYQLFYSLPYARVGSLVNKVKLKQSIITGLAVPICASLEFFNLVPTNITPVCLFICASSNLAFYCIGQLFFKLVGKAYVDEQKKIVKIAYIGFFGKRTEVEVAMDEIVPPGEETPGLLYSKLRFNNSKLVLKLQEKYYDYCDLDLARKVFGESFQRD